MTIHQAFYGEVNRAHSCIRQTIIDPDLTSFLIAFTDRPAALPPGMTLKPYLSGSAFSNYYVFTKTFSDTTATRAGMVFTHVLILKLEDSNNINNIHDIFTHFANSPACKNDDIEDFQAVISEKDFDITSQKHQPKYVQETISAFISGVKPILFSGSLTDFRIALQQIWNVPNKLSRKKIKFRTSFTMSDIENVKDLTIVFIQKDFLPKWHGQKIIIGENSDVVEITSLSEALFLGHKKGNPFYDFLLELNVDLSEVQKYGQYEKIFDNYRSLSDIEDANVLRQDVRILAKISPSPDNGKVIKEKYLNKVCSLIENEGDLNIKALRNINLKSFYYGEQTLGEMVFDFVSINVLKGKNFDILDEILDIACMDEAKNWWSEAIIDAINTPLSVYTMAKLKNFWLFICNSEQSCKNVFSLISSDKNNEYYLDKEIPDSINDPVWNTLLKILKVRKWYLLHSKILLKKLGIEEALLQQIKLEEKLALSASVGLKYLSDKLIPEKLIGLAVKTGDKKLIELSVDAIEKDESLLKMLDLSNPVWFEIWNNFVIKTNRVFAGMAGQEVKIVSSVLDLVINGQTINDTVIGMIADSPFSDLSNYKNRAKVWDTIGIAHKDKFLNSTTDNVLNKLLDNKIDPTEIEREISNNITTDVFMSKFLSKNRYNIDPVIKVFSSFDNLKDNFLADFISFYGVKISEEQAVSLGKLISNSEFSKSARVIYNKAKYNSAFTPAYLHCKDLVKLNWFESLLGSSPQPYKQIHTMSNPSLSKENASRSQLPTVVILTAIKEEYKAVREHLIEIVEADKNDTGYEAGIFKFNQREFAKVIIRECGPKNTNAAQETERAIQYFTPDMILFVGIAGSRKPKDFSVGDVIFPSTVLSYEGGKSEQNAFLSRPDGALMTFALLEMAKKERNKEDWKLLIKGGWDKNIKADIGIIASGEQIVEHYNSEIGKILHKHFNHTQAVEMEGFGFGNAANRQGRALNNMLIGVVRGISDIISQSSDKDEIKIHDRRPDNVKDYASATASAFAFWLVLKMYE